MGAARSEDKVSLFDMSQKRVIGECSASKVKYVVWAADMSRVALLSKHGVRRARDAHRLGRFPICRPKEFATSSP